MTTHDEQRLIEEIGKRIDQYSTALIRIADDMVYPLTDLFEGCGTFVQIDGQFGILTAHHVATKLTSPCQLGLILKHEETQQFMIDSSNFIVCEVAIPDRGTERPDLAFIGISESDVYTISAHKQFINLSAERDVVLSNPLALNKGAWFIWGAAVERNTIEPPEGMIETILGLHGLCGPGLAVNEEVEPEHDYIDIQVEYREGYDTPKSFRGYSGGGIWQVLIEGINTNSPTPTDYIYSGVIFFQSDVIDQKRLLNCHGRRSVYGYAYNKIRNRCA